jgi:hypothetical protein
MTDAELDREIEAALAVDPSAQWVARVRSEVARQPIAAGLPWSWAIASAAAVAILIAIMSGIRNEEVARLKPSPTEATGPTEVTGATEATSATEMASASEIATPTEVTGPIENSKSADTLIRDTRTSPEMLEVIVDPGGVRAFHQLVISTRERAFEASFDDNVPSTPWAMTDLSMPPIIILPLEPPAANN